MADTAIEWTDAVWNPTTGCDRVSAGCDNCYALTMAKRLKAMGQAKYQTDGDPRTSGPGFGLATHDDALAIPLKWRKPRRVFVNSMSDLFHDKVPDEFIAEVFAVMAATPWHTYQVLTKRHARMRALLRPGADGKPSRLLDAMPDDDPTLALILLSQRWPLPNVWLGVSVENQQWADIRIPALLDTPAAVRWLSIEPLLGYVDLGIGDPHRGHGADCVDGCGYPCYCLDCSDEDADRVRYFRRDDIDSQGISWVVAGGESGPGFRSMRLPWLECVVTECAQASVPLFVKQDSGPKPGKQGRIPDEIWALKQYPRGGDSAATRAQYGRHRLNPAPDGGCRLCPLSAGDPIHVDGTR